MVYIISFDFLFEGLYQQFDRIVLEEPRPKRFEYVNSDWMTWYLHKFRKQVSGLKVQYKTIGSFQNLRFRN